ncbi:MAG: hypothetical protein R3C59_11870 [Planctomycetaceae bacterium]
MLLPACCLLVQHLSSVLLRAGDMLPTCCDHVLSDRLLHRCMLSNTMLRHWMLYSMPSRPSVRSSRTTTLVVDDVI